MDELQHHEDIYRKGYIAGYLDGLDEALRKKTRRNMEIYDLYIHGIYNLRELGELYEITYQRVQGICAAERKRRKNT